MTAALSDHFGELSAKFLKVLRGDVAKGLCSGHALGKKSRGCLALRAPLVVFTRGYAMPHHGIANHESHAGRNGYLLKLQGPAIQAQPMIPFAVYGNELIHDPAARAYKFIFRPLA